MNGILYGVGVGPGDPELMTLKAIKTIKNCGVIACPGKEARETAAYRIALSAVPELSEKELLSLDMPMQKDRDALKESHKEAAKILCRLLSEGKSIALLTLGDPCIYSTCLYLLELAAGAGFETRLVSGVPSFCAAAAAAKVPLCEWDEALFVIPAAHRLPETLRPDTDYVFLKAGKKLPQIRELADSAGRGAVLAENCGLENETILKGSAMFPESAGYFTLVLVR